MLNSLAVLRILVEKSLKGSTVPFSEALMMMFNSVHSVLEKINIA